MTNRNTYPEREHLEPINDFYDVMQFELSIHPNGPELRKGLSTLSSMYSAFPLSRSMQQYSRLMAISHAKAGHSQYEQGLDIDFHRGSVFATHCMLRSQTAKKRGILLRDDIFSEYLTDDERYIIPEKDLDSMIESLTIWSRGEFMNSLSEEPDELQELVIAAAIRAYDDVSNVPENEFSFISGFMMAKDMLVMKLIEINNIPHEERYIFPSPPV